jgi:hypothetical protein
MLKIGFLTFIQKEVLMETTTQHKAEFLQEVLKTISVKNSISKHDFAQLKSKYDETTNNITLILKLAQQTEELDKHFPLIKANLIDTLENIERLRDQLIDAERNFAHFRDQLQSNLEIFDNFK